MKALGVVIEHLHLAVVHRRALELFASSERAFESGSGFNVLEAGTYEGRTLAWFDVQKLDNGPEVVINNDRDAVAEVVRRNHDPPQYGFSRYDAFREREILFS